MILNIFFDRFAHSTLQIESGIKEREATMGFEPMMGVLQTLAFPLGHVAGIKKLISNSF